MRISDWSADVCSCDRREILLDCRARRVRRYLELGFLAGLARLVPALDLVNPVRIRDPRVVAHLVADVEEDHQARGHADGEAEYVDEGVGLVLGQGPDADRKVRSEEHTSELQSLMRTSYAVFCLQKKNQLT